MIAQTRRLTPEVLQDPLAFSALCWPDIRFYDKQVEIIESVRDNDETICPAGNALGKDFVSAFIALWFFCSRSPVRVVTTSVDQPQLKGVLWGEIRRFIQTSRYRLPIQVNDLLIRQVMPDGSVEPLSYLIGRVTAKGEGLLGHHVPTEDKVSDPRTLAIFDEASGCDNTSREVVDTWAHRVLIIGNPYPCTNFFFTGVRDGSLLAPTGDRYYRKVIQIKAIDSPNIRFAEAQERRGVTPTDEVLVPGVADYSTYKKRRVMWDPVRQSIGLDAEFYEGEEVKLYPPAWLARADDFAKSLSGRSRTLRRTMGVDVGEGGDNTCWTVVDRQQVLYQLSFQTPDTSVIPGQTFQLMREWKINPEDVLFDRGGGGKEHVDLMRNKPGMKKIRTVGFGEQATDPKILSRTRTIIEREVDKEEAYTYKNRRAEMYGLARLHLKPDYNPAGFGIDATKYEELVRQMRLVPLCYDPEGRLYLPPKNKRSKTSEEETLVDIIGCSPDEMDSFVLAMFGQLRVRQKRKARVFA